MPGRPTQVKSVCEKHCNYICSASRNGLQCKSLVPLTVYKLNTFFAQGFGSTPHKTIKYGGNE